MKFIAYATALAALAACATTETANTDAAMVDASIPAVTPVVETTYGKIQGFKDAGVDAFLGVRYAAPPIGDKRFLPPTPPTPWEGVYDATGLGAPAMQMYVASGPRQSDFTTQMQTIFPTGQEEKVDNEDSLFLNVWTPAADEGDRPVMVWFHGGGYAYGSGGWPAYDGRNLAEKGDVVVVTVNHRLNVFGYLYLGEKFGPEFAMSGNLGNLDLIASLQWVKDNIAAFGGDPDNVTIMGESGGGSKVSHLLAMPGAEGLFHKAIIQSGPGVTSGKKDEAAALADDLLAELGVDTIAELRAVPAEDVLNAGRAVLASRRGGLMGGANFGPIVDGAALPRDPFVPAAPEQSRDIPVMIGWNKDETTIFTAAQPWFGTLTDAQLDAMAPMFGGEDGPALIANYRELEPDYSPTYVANRAMSARFVYGSYVLADQKARQGGAPVYMYWLTQETPVNGGILKAPHTLDIPFMFDNVEESRVLVGPGEEPEIVADMMSDAWITFARTGTPSSPLLPEWRPYSPEARWAMEFNVDPKMVDDPERGAREILSAGSAR